MVWRRWLPHHRFAIRQRPALLEATVDSARSSCHPRGGWPRALVSHSPLCRRHRRLSRGAASTALHQSPSSTAALDQTFFIGGCAGASVPNLDTTTIKLYINHSFSPFAGNEGLDLWPQP